MKIIVPFFSLFFIWQLISAQPTNPVITYPQQNATGFGGSNYQFDAVKMSDFAEKPDGYWLFEPEQSTTDTLNVVVFVHGYGAYNPMIYGKWIKHLVKKGNVVIFPRYQRNLFSPTPKKFAKNVAQGIKDALVELQNSQHAPIHKDHFFLVGHSYGGVIISDLCVNYEAFGIPKPLAAQLCAPGTGGLKGGRLASYEGMSDDLNLLIIASKDDPVVGDEFAELVYKTATNTPNRNYIMQYADYHGRPYILAGHNECYSLDEDFDTGIRNVTAKRALRISSLDPLDYNGYWKLFDALMDYSLTGHNKDFCLGNTPEQTQLGEWSDGKTIRPLEVKIPSK